MHLYRDPRRGQILVFIVSSVSLFFGLAALSVDLIYAYAVKVRLVTAVDACALGAARSLGAGQTEVDRTIDLLFVSNFPPGFMLTTSSSHTPATITTPTAGMRQVALVGNATVPTFFMRWAGYTSLPLAHPAKAVRRDVNLMLLLDRSGSMNRAPGANPGPTAMDDLKAAAYDFVARFDDTTDRLGLVSFGSAANVDFIPATSFKSTVLAQIGNLYADNSGTNTAAALWMGYNALLALNDPDSLNFMVFFTDGVSTHFNGSFRTNTNPPGSSCDNKDVPGVLGTYSSPGSDFSLGLTVINPGSPPVYADQFDFVSGCGFGSSSDANTKIPTLPLTDLYGTSVQGFRPINYWSGGKPITTGLNTKPISENLTANTATRARTDPVVPVGIYTIGLGGETNNYPADHVLMRMIANDPGAGTYDDQQVTGMYVYAPSSLQLQQAFQTVGREIFRLIQ